MFTKPSFLAVVLALVALAMLSGCGAVKGKAAAERAVTDFHSKLDAADFKTIYDGAHADLKQASTNKDFTILLEAIHRKLGKVQKSEEAGWNVSAVNLQTNVTLTYKTKFAEGDAIETFVYRVNRGSALLCGYNINSTALITK
jgi:hypothetical protein